jgi:hypothetical protein
MKESGGHALKLEGGQEIIESIKRILTAGIPVMGHLGLTPQSIYKFGTYVVRAKEEQEAQRLIEDALALEESGCFAIVLEKIPAQLAELVAKTVSIPIIGIGAGNPFTIEGLENYIIPHKKSAPEKNRIQLENNDHLVTEGIYAIGTLAGHRSQLVIAAGSGASAATDVLTLWNDGKPVQIHDAVKE